MKRSPTLRARHDSYHPHLAAVSVKPGGCTGTVSLQRALVRRCKRGDRAAWDELIRHYGNTVYRFAYSLCRNEEDTADIAAQVFIRIYENMHGFREEANFSSWVFCIVRNVYVDTCYRAKGRKDVSLDEGLDIGGERLIPEIVDPGPTPEHCALKVERQGRLDWAISHLPPYQRNIVVMFHGEQMTYEEIASLTGLAVGTVKSRLSRARNMLRRHLEGFEDVVSW